MSECCSVALWWFFEEFHHSVHFARQAPSNGLSSCSVCRSVCCSVMSIELIFEEIHDSWVHLAWQGSRVVVDQCGGVCQRVGHRHVQWGAWWRVRSHLSRMCVNVLSLVCVSLCHGVSCLPFVCACLVDQGRGVCETEGYRYVIEARVGVSFLTSLLFLFLSLWVSCPSRVCVYILSLVCACVSLWVSCLSYVCLCLVCPVCVRVCVYESLLCVYVSCLSCVGLCVSRLSFVCLFLVCVSISCPST